MSRENIDLIGYKNGFYSLLLKRIFIKQHPIIMRVKKKKIGIINLYRKSDKESLQKFQ